MKKLLLILTVSTVFISGNCSAINRMIKGMSTEGVTESYERGGLVLTCQKKNKITLYNTTSKINCNCNFYQRITNQSQEPISFTPRNISITDQEGRHLALVTKSEVLTRLSQKSAQKQSDLDSWYIREKQRLTLELEDVLTEKILLERGEFPARYRETAERTIAGRVVPGERADQWELRREEEKRRKELKEQIRKILRREREVRVALQELPSTYEHERADLLERNRIEVENAHHHYLDSYTIMPGETYAKNFQIKVPQHWVKDLQYVYITYQLDRDHYTFTYRVNQRFKQRARKSR